MPASPPLMPTMTLLSTTSGAAVTAWPVGLSPTWTAQRWTPVFASSATRNPSSVPTYTVLSRIATPRLTRGNPRFNTVDAIGRLHSQIGRPLRTSSATTLAGAEVTYMMPSATTGVPSSAPTPGGWYTHSGFSPLMFEDEI